MKHELVAKIEMSEAKSKKKNSFIHIFKHIVLKQNSILCCIGDSRGQIKIVTYKLKMELLFLIFR